MLRQQPKGGPALMACFCFLAIIWGGWGIAGAQSGDPAVFRDQRTLTAANATEAYGNEFDDALEDTYEPDPDPLYYWNKAMFHFNDKLYFWVLKPIGSTYKNMMPQPVRISLKNFFHNLQAPIRIVNCILQAKGEAAGGELSRFMLNTTVGILGFGNPAQKYPELNPGEEDLGQTLALYGLGDGCYVIWPVLGPSNLRDSIAMGGDYVLYPVNYLHPYWIQVVTAGLENLNNVSFRIGDYEALKNAAFDPYEAMRDAYSQHREAKIAE